MPTLNDFGDAAVYRVEQAAQKIAADLGVQKEVIYGFFNDTAHFPQTLDELNAWGNRPTKYGVSRRDPQTGAWHPIMPGVNPDPRLTALDRGGFPHNITNAEDSRIERFQQVNPDGTVFGGSHDPAYNAAHPEIARYANAYEQLAAGAGAAPGNDPNARQQLMGRSAQGFDQNNYVAPSPVGFVSVVNGVPNQFATQGEAENDYNSRTGGGSSQGAPPAGPSVGAPGPGSAGPGASPATGGTAPGSLFNPSAASAANAAVLAFLEQRRIDEIEKPELALKTQTELAQMRRDDALAVWKQAYEAATLTGNLNGTPTLDATKQQADLTGYTGQGYATRAQGAYMGLAPEQRNAQSAAAIWQSIVPGLTPEEAAAMDAVGHQYYATTHQVMPDDVAAQNLARITNGRITGTGSQPTAAFQHQQNQDALSALTLLSNLRGPENAFAYANTLANLPESVRQTIAAAQQNLPTAYGPRNPAQAGLLGDVTGRTGLGQAQTQQSGNAAMASPAVLQGLPAATGPRTTVDPMAAYRAGAGPAQPGSSVDQMGRIYDDGRVPAGPTGQPGVYAPVQPVLRTGQADVSFADASRGNPQPGMSYAQVITPAGGATQQTQSVLRMDPATQAAIGAQVGAPPATGVQTGTPALVAAPGVGGVPPTGYGPRTQPAVLPLPNQISPTDFNNTNIYARKLMLAGYENAGQDKEAVMDAYNRSLPRAYGPRTGRLRAA